MADDGDAGREIQIRLVGLESAPILYANHFVIQYQPDEYILTVAQVAPPVLLGTDEQKLEQVEQLEFVPAQVLARFALSRRRVEEVIGILQNHLARFDQLLESQGRESQDG